MDPTTQLVRLQYERARQNTLQLKATKLRQVLYNMSAYISDDDYSIPRMGTWGPTGHLHSVRKSI